MEITDFDELNRLVGFKRSMPIDTYFGEMKLTRQQKEHRKELANKLYDEFLWLMAYMFYARQQGIGVSLDAIDEIRRRYREAIGNTIAIDLYLAMHIDSITADIVDVTNKHRDDEVGFAYFYSADRARLIAENESNSVWNYTEYADAVKNKKYKTWNTIMDGRERDSHAEVNGVTIPINDYFILQGGSCLFPRSDELPEEEVCNCRCSLTFS